MTRARRVLAAAALLVSVTGCASGTPSGGVALLERADRLAHEGSWEEAAATKLRGDLARLRQALARSDSELDRVRQESDRLKADLEHLKQVDLTLERRK